MYIEYAAVLVFLCVGTMFVFGCLFAGSFLRSRRPNPGKVSVYECGEPTIGSSWIRFNSRFYNIALVYLLFDVEVVVLFPAALVIREKAELGTALVPVVGLIAFLSLLVLGLAYEWYYGNLDWLRYPATPTATQNYSGEQVLSKTEQS